MELSYNGVRLELLQLDRVERTGIYTADKADLLYVEWVIGATCTYSPGGKPVGTAVTGTNESAIAELNRVGLVGTGFGGVQVPDVEVRGVDPNAVDEAGPQETNFAFDEQVGFNAVITDATLRNALWQPRRKLLIQAWGGGGPLASLLTWLESPRPGYLVDATVGPTPLAVDVISATGDGQTFGVHFQIKTCLPPCPFGSDRLILSHRWEMSHGHDSDYYLTRTITGEVVFNNEILTRTGIKPDWIRNQLFHPIPLGFRRNLPNVTQSSDGLTLRYTYTDTDPTVMFVAGDSGCTQMDIVEKVAYSQPSRLF